MLLCGSNSASLILKPLFCKRGEVLLALSTPQSCGETEVGNRFYKSVNFTCQLPSLPLVLSPHQRPVSLADSTPSFVLFPLTPQAGRHRGDGHEHWGQAALIPIPAVSLTALLSWGNPLTSLCLSLLVCEVGRREVPLSWTIVRTKWVIVPRGVPWV